MHLCIGLVIMLCQPPPPPPVMAEARFCSVSQPIRWSRHDSEETRRQARAHNAAGKALCGWGP